MHFFTSCLLKIHQKAHFHSEPVWLSLRCRCCIAAAVIRMKARNLDGVQWDRDKSDRRYRMTGNNWISHDWSNEKTWHISTRFSFPGNSLAAPSVAGYWSQSQLRGGRRDPPWTEPNLSWDHHGSRNVQSMAQGQYAACWDERHYVHSKS